MLLYISTCKTSGIVLCESSPCTGSNKIYSKQDQLLFLVVTFKKIVFTHLRRFGNVIKMKTNKQDQLTVVSFLQNILI